MIAQAGLFLIDTLTGFLTVLISQSGNEFLNCRLENHEGMAGCQLHRPISVRLIFYNPLLTVA